MILSLVIQQTKSLCKFFCKTHLLDLNGPSHRRWHKGKYVYAILEELQKETARFTISFENHAQMNGESISDDVHMANNTLDLIPNGLDEDREIQGLGVWRGDVLWRWRWLEVQMAHLDKQLANHKKSLDAASAAVASRDVKDVECSRTRGYVPSRTCRTFKNVGANGKPKQLSPADKKKHPLFGFPVSKGSTPINAVTSGTPAPTTRTRRKSTRGRKSLSNSRVRKVEQDVVPMALSSSRSSIPEAPKIIHTPTWRKVDFGEADAKYRAKKMARRNLTMSAPSKLTRKKSRITRDVKRITVVTPKGKNNNKLTIKGHSGDELMIKKQKKPATSSTRANAANFGGSSADDDDIILLISNPKVPQDTNHKANGHRNGSGYQTDVNHVNNRLVKTQKPYTDPTNSGIHLIKAIPQPVKNNARNAVTNGANNRQNSIKSKPGESKDSAIQDDLNNIKLDQPVDLEDDEEMPFAEHSNGTRLEDMEYTSSSSSDEELEEEFYNFMHFQKEVEEKMLFETATKDRKRLRPRDIKTSKKDYMESPLRPSYDCQPYPPRVPDGEWMASPMPKRSKRRKKSSRKSNRGRKRKAPVVSSLLPNKFPKTLRAIPVTQVSATDQVYALASVQPSTRYKGNTRRRAQHRKNAPPKRNVVWEVLNKPAPVDPKTNKKRNVIYLRCKAK